jgi:hypothetical protein
LTPRATEQGAIHVCESPLGFGIFAGKSFRKNEFLFRFSGPIITLAEAIAKGEAEGNVLQIGLRSYIDLEAPGVFGNHSCQPNAGLRDQVFCYALNDIAEGEEIFYDYSTTMSERRWTMQCQCGTLACRGVIGDFHDLPLRLQRRYLAMKIVMPFIVEELRDSNRTGKGAASLSSGVVRRRSRPFSREPARITRYAPC